MLKREPTLDDLLNDPVIRKVMKADGHSAEDILSLMHQAGARMSAPRLQQPFRTASARERLPMPAMAAVTSCCQPSCCQFPM